MFDLYKIIFTLVIIHTTGMNHLKKIFHLCSPCKCYARTLDASLPAVQSSYLILIPSIDIIQRTQIIIRR